MTTIHNATRRELENYLIDSVGMDNLEEYTTEELRGLFFGNKEEQLLFIGYAN